MIISKWRGRSAVAALLFASSLPAADGWRDGDIIFQTSRSAQSVAIQRATLSRMFRSMNR
jgi:hypothetical protein